MTCTLVMYPIVRNYTHSDIASQGIVWGFFLTSCVSMVNASSQETQNKEVIQQPQRRMTVSRERGIRFLSRFAFLRRKARLKGRGDPRRVRKSAGPDFNCAQSSASGRPATLSRRDRGAANTS